MHIAEMVGKVCVYGRLLRDVAGEGSCSALQGCIEVVAIKQVLSLIEFVHSPQLSNLSSMESVSLRVVF